MGKGRERGPQTPDIELPEDRVRIDVVKLDGERHFNIPGLRIGGSVPACAGLAMAKKIATGMAVNSAQILLDKARLGESVPEQVLKAAQLIVDNNGTEGDIFEFEVTDYR